MLAANSDDTGIEDDVATGSVAGDTGRQVLAGLGRATASQQYLAEHGEQVTDADRDAVRPRSRVAARAAQRRVDLVLDFQAAAAARVASPRGDAQARYEESPAISASCASGTSSSTPRRRPRTC